MKILILHQHFRTPSAGGAIRSWYLGQELAARGHQVVILTAHGERKYKVAVEQGVEIHYFPIAYDNRFGFVRRTMSFIRYNWWVIRKAGNFRDFDVCYAMSVPLTVGLAGRTIQRKYGIRFVFEVGDLWPDAPVQIGAIKNGFLIRRLYNLELALYRAADTIVALSPAIREVIIEKSGRDDVQLVTNMADTNFFTPEEKKQELEKRYGVEGKFVISYIGAIGLANGLEHLVVCATAAAHAALPIHFLVCGDGAMLPRLRQRVDAAGLANVSILPFRSRAGVKEILNVTDAMLISYKPLPVLETGSPNKYFDGLAAGKLIVTNFGGWIARDVEENRCGVRVDSHDPEAFVRVIRPFTMDTALLKEFQQNARNLAEAKYAREIMGEKLDRIIRKVTSAKV